MNLWKIAKEEPEKLAEVIEDIKRDRTRSDEYRKFYNEYDIDPTKYNSQLLIRAFNQWNTTWGTCKRCLPEKCTIKDEHLEIRDGKIIEVECEKVGRYASTNLPDRLLEKEFNTYKPQNRSQEMALDKCKKVVRRPVSLMLMGPNGIGKTHLCSVVFNSLDLRGHYINYSLFANGLKDILTEDKPITPEVKILREIPLLFVDDFGKGNYSNWIRDLVYGIIETRIQHDKITLLTSDLTMTQLKLKLSSDILSRLKREFLIVKLEGEDYSNRLQEQRVKEYEEE